MASRLEQPRRPSSPIRYWSTRTARAPPAVVVSLLEEEPYRKRARDLAEEIESMPDPAALVPILVGAAH
jgi:hypothetical protein